MDHKKKKHCIQHEPSDVRDCCPGECAGENKTQGLGYHSHFLWWPIFHISIKLYYSVIAIEDETCEIQPRLCCDNRQTFFPFTKKPIVCAFHLFKSCQDTDIVSFTSVLPFTLLQGIMKGWKKGTGLNISQQGIRNAKKQQEVRLSHFVGLAARTSLQSYVRQPFI